jgi:hypothetical protein
VLRRSRERLRATTPLKSPRSSFRGMAIVTTGFPMVYLQWQKDASGNLIRPIVWPEAAQAATPLYPLSR